MDMENKQIKNQKTKQPVDNLFFLLDLLFSDEDLKPSSTSYQWLRSGILKCITQGDGGSLDRALGLAVCGSRHISYQLKLRVRNAYLVESVKLIALNERVSDWERCKRLALKLNQLAAFWDAHPRVLSFDNWEGWKVNLYNAWAIGCGLPTTARGLYAVIENNPCSLHSLEMKIHKTIIKARANEQLVRYKSS